MQERTRLIITRRRGEAVTVGDATITVEAIGDGRARLVIEAPRSTVIVRDDARPLQGTPVEAPTEIVTDFSRTTIERPRPL